MKIEFIPTVTEKYQLEYKSSCGEYIKIACPTNAETETIDDVKAWVNSGAARALLWPKWPVPRPDVTKPIKYRIRKIRIIKEIISTNYFEVSIK